MTAMNRHLSSALKNDFLTFARRALRKLDDTVLDHDPYLELLTTYLLEFADGSTKRLLINMPPRHAKTKLCSICFSAWILAHNPSIKIMIVAYSIDLAESISRAIRNILQSVWFKESFPTRVAKGHAKSNDFATTAGGKVYATSFDGSVTGFGGDIIIVDDPHNISDVENPRQLERTIEKFNTMLVRRLDTPKKGRIMVIGHRVHENDLSAALLQDGSWTNLRLPIVAPRDQEFRTAYGRWHRRKGELLRPDADDLTEIERLRSKLVNPPFELLYQQDDDAQSLPALTADHFLSYRPEDIFNLPRFVSVDPGTDEGDGRSFSVVQLWATNGVINYLVDQVRKRCDFRELVRITKRIVCNNTGAPILIENTANGPALISALSEAQKRRAYAITPRDSKTTRLRRHYDKFLSGRIRVQSDAQFREKLTKEFIVFPHGRHADQVDATTQFLDFIVKRDDIDFSKTNIKRAGTMGRALNSKCEPTPARNMPGIMVVDVNSHRGFLGRPQVQDPKAPAIMAVSKPPMPNAPFPQVKAWIRW
jgi:predicted phage terminase large subunit-like protein